MTTCLRHLRLLHPLAAQAEGRLLAMLEGKHSAAELLKQSGVTAPALQAAIEAFPVAAEGAVDDAARQLEEMRREAASSIVVPGQGGGGGGGGMGGLGGAGGMPGGGIQLR